MTVAVGATAPEFELANQFGEQVRLSEFRGVRPVVLVFFPLAFSSTCTSELGVLRDNPALFSDSGAQLLAVSVDSKAALRAWSEQEGYGFPLLSDFWPHGAVAHEYGALVDDKGYASRSTFVIDRDGIIRDTFLSPAGEPRPIERYRAALAALSTR